MRAGGADLLSGVVTARRRTAWGFRKGLFLGQMASRDVSLIGDAPGMRAWGIRCARLIDGKYIGSPTSRIALLGRYIPTA